MEIKSVSKDDLLILIKKLLDEIQNGHRWRHINIRCRPSDRLVRNTKIGGHSALEKIYHVKIKENTV